MAALLLLGGTVVVEGTPEEVSAILALQSGEAPSKTRSGKKREVSQRVAAPDDVEMPSLAEVVNAAKQCDEAELIES